MPEAFAHRRHGKLSEWNGLQTPHKDNSWNEEQAPLEQVLGGLGFKVLMHALSKELHMLCIFKEIVFM
jgi:hypothetical protein